MKLFQRKNKKGNLFPEGLKESGILEDVSILDENKGDKENKVILENYR